MTTVGIIAIVVVVVIVMILLGGGQFVCDIIEAIGDSFGDD